MRRTWTTVSVLLWACAGGPAPEPKTAAAVPVTPQSTQQAAPPAVAAEKIGASAAAPKPAAGQSAAAMPAAKTTTVSTEQTCTPVPNAKPKVVTGESQVLDSAERGQAIIFEIAGIAIELPACTPEADMQLSTVSWETQDRPNAAHIHPNFTRHGATLRFDQALTAQEGSPLQVRLHSKRELSKPGEKLVLAVESAGECDEAHKRDKLESGDCAHWQLFDATFDAASGSMLARIPATGGYRLQFGWVPTK